MSLDYNVLNLLYIQKQFVKRRGRVHPSKQFTPKMILIAFDIQEKGRGGTFKNCCENFILSI